MVGTSTNLLVSGLLEAEGLAPIGMLELTRIGLPAAVVGLVVLLAVSVILMCLLFVTVDLGRPDRFYHIMPWVGRMNFPISMLAWDVVVINAARTAGVGAGSSSGGR